MDPARWPGGAAAPSGPGALTVIGWAFALSASSADEALEDIRRLDLSAAGVSERALGHYPMTAAEVERFLVEAGVLTTPEDAAVAASGALAALGDERSPVDVTSNVLDLWRRAHTTFDPGADHVGRCDCLFHCPLVPAAIRALDEANQVYYEAHHELPAPECFGASDPEQLAALRRLLAACTPTR